LKVLGLGEDPLLDARDPDVPVGLKVRILLSQNCIPSL